MSDSPLPTQPVGEISPAQYMRETKKDAEPFFIAGENDRPEDNRIVAVTIGVRCKFKTQDREASGPVCIHLIPTLRKFYELQGGSVEIEPGWPVKLERLRPLTASKLKQEIDLISSTYKIPTDNGGAIDCVLPFLGATPDDRLRNLRDQMEQQMEAWKKLVEIGKARLAPEAKALHPAVQLSLAYENFTAKELEQIVDMGDPSKRATSEIDLSEIVVPNLEATPASLDAPKLKPSIDLDKLQKEIAENMEKEGDEIDAALARLKTAGFNEGQSIALASLIDLHGGGAKIPANEIERVLGSKAKLAEAKAALKG